MFTKDPKAMCDHIMSHQLGMEDTFRFSCQMCGSCCRKRSEPIVVTGTDILYIAKALNIPTV